ncbi:MAG: helix-turn-helix domain-containing protein [Phycisphaeraceae bacterium]|nr:helix-turn-helix domain-containing protein [Phycisphaeraceae bacterium]
MTEPLLSADDVAAFLGVKRDTVYKLIDRNKLPALKVGRLWKFRQPEIDMWLDKQAGRRRTDTVKRPSHGRGA